MATFYYDRYSNENINSQWIKHLQTSSYINDIDNIVTQNRRELQSTLQKASTQQAIAIQQVCGTIEDGFAEVSNHLRSINSNISELRGEINEMAAMLDWKLSMLIEEQRLTNHLLGHIAKLLRIPDSQKQRIYFIEQGLKYLKNAILEGINSSFFADAIEGFKEAEKIERKDYITLNRIGQIHLYSEKYLDIPAAEEYFLKSAREAFAESNAGGTTTSNNLTPFGYETNIYSENPFKAATAEAYLYASRACYLQQKLNEATVYAEKAYKLIPEFVEAGFEQAKYLAANNKETEAANVLKTVIEKDRFFSIKTLNDQDLSTKPTILKLLEELQKEIILKSNSGLNKCLKLISSNSQAESIIDEIKINISKNSYLSGMKAHDLLFAQYSFPINTYRQSSEEIDTWKITPSLKLEEFIHKENNSTLEFEDVKQKVRKEIVLTRLAIFGFGSGALGFVIGFFKGCSVENFSEDWGLMFSTLLFFVFIGAVIGLFVGFVTEPKINKR